MLNSGLASFLAPAELYLDNKGMGGSSPEVCVSKEGFSV